MQKWQRLNCLSAESWFSTVGFLQKATVGYTQQRQSEKLTDLTYFKEKPKSQKEGGAGGLQLGRHTKQLLTFSV